MNIEEFKITEEDKVSIRNKIRGWIEEHATEDDLARTAAMMR
ncbi:MAG: hypothetical protein ACE5ES_02485 [Candidatus Nanoarchaeia archaeon]